MRSICIIATGTMLMASAIGAAAQTAGTAAPPGKPIQLLQIVERSDKTVKPKTANAKSHTKSAAKTHLTRAHARSKHVHSKTTHLAAKTHERVPLPAKVPPATAVTAFEPSPEAAHPVSPEPTPDVISVAGQTVQVATPEEFNEIDLAATDDPSEVDDATPDANVAVSSTPDTGLTSTAEIAASQHQHVPARRDTSWIAQALAALGGAVAAASAAWFLIGSTPVRTYG